MPPTISISNHCQSPVRTALAFSLGMAATSLLMLDFGQSARLTAIALLIFWLCVAIAITKRPNSPTTTDLALIRCASLPFSNRIESNSAQASEIALRAGSESFFYASSVLFTITASAWP